jgi:HK97 family phage major capsid protein
MESTLMSTIVEQIAAYEAKMAANVEAMKDIMEKSGAAGETLDDAQQEEFDGLTADNDAIKGHLKRLGIMKSLNVASATPVTEPKSHEDGASQRGRVSAIVKAPALPKGTLFARYVGALAHAKGSRFEASMFAKERWPDHPQIAEILRLPTDIIEKTAVSAGSTSDSTWASPLVEYTNMASEFIEYLRPLTVMGRMSGFRRVPFNVKVPRQTGGASVNWVGEGKVKPLSSLAFDSLTLDFNKVAGIIPMTEELVRFSSPSSDELVRSDLAAAIAQFLDAEFLDPSNASTDVSPASVTYGVSAITSTGTTAAAFRADVKSMFAAMLAANQQVSSGYWVMTQGQALGFSLMRNALDQAEFPGVTMNGGTLLGFPVLVTENLSASTGSPADGYPIIFVMPAEILLADEGGVSIDMSREASLQMETTPDSPVTASTVTVNLWQHNMVAIKAERFITWKARRSTAAGFIAGAKYSA